MKNISRFTLLIASLLSLSACQSGAPLPLAAPAPQLARFASTGTQPGPFQFTAIKDLNIQFTGGMSFMRISVEYQLNRGEKSFKRQVQFKYLLASKEVTDIVVLAGDRGSAEELKQECAAIMRLQIKQ